MSCPAMPGEGACAKRYTDIHVPNAVRTPVVFRCGPSRGVRGSVLLALVVTGERWSRRCPAGCFWFGEVAVDGGSGGTEFLGDLFDGVGAFSVWSLFLVHFAGRFELAWSEFWFLSAGASTCPGSGEPVPGAFGHERVFEFGDGSDDLEEYAANGG